MTSLAMAAPPLASVNVKITDLRNNKGQLIICLTQKPKGFPDCSKDAAAMKKTIPASNVANIRFENIAPGTYAIAVFHDENTNNKMDLRIFIPREGFAFSRDPKIGVGPPKFKNASFLVGADDVSQSMKMKYIF